MAERISIEDMKNMFKDPVNSSNDNPAQVLKATRNKLYTMFCSPMKEEYLHEAFNWVSNLCLTNGVQFWTSDKTNWSQEDAKIFSCVARLSIGELEILLPLIQRHLTCGEDPEMDEGKMIARSANSTDYDRFGNHLVILESVIKCLVEGQDLDEANESTIAKPPSSSSSSKTNLLTDLIKGTELINLLDRLREIMDMICEYLELVHRYWDKLNQDTQSDKFSSAEAALRIISVWLSEEPESFKHQCDRFLIDLLIKNLLLSDRPSKDDLLILALHSICTQDDDLMKTLKKVPRQEEALERYLDYVQKEQDRSNVDEKRNKKLFKLRCGLVKDLVDK